MPGSTPNQGFSYPLSTDRPCDWPAPMLSLATALDTKAQGYDTDAARLATRKWGKISRTSFAFNSSSNSEIAFDTVENNTGTSTDLTVDPYSLILPAGCWVIQAKIIVPTNAFGNNYFSNIGINGVPNVGNIVTSQISRDFDGLLSLTTLTLGGISYFTTGTAKVNLFFVPSPTSLTVDYASLAAWWVSDP